MFTKMLVATDLSQASDQVVCALAGLKALKTRQALLVHCLNIRDVGTLANQLTALAQPTLDRQKRLLEELGFETEARIVLGLPHVEINRIAEEAGASMIVVGSHGQTMASEILLGGVASAVINSASKPVLLLRLRLRREEDGRAVCEPADCDPLRHVLFPTDFSDNAEHAFAFVRQIAEVGARRITLLHVQDEAKLSPHLSDRLEEFKRIDTDRLTRLKHELEGLGVADVQIEIPYGSPKKEIVERTRGDVSLVIMGSQGRGFLAELFLGSVSLAVARRSEAPVLLVPQIR